MITDQFEILMKSKLGFEAYVYQISAQSDQFFGPYVNSNTSTFRWATLYIP
jgi:hypothetical protein